MSRLVEIIIGIFQLIALLIGIVMLVGGGGCAGMFLLNITKSGPDISIFILIGLSTAMAGLMIIISIAQKWRDEFRAREAAKKAPSLTERE